MATLTKSVSKQLTDGLKRFQSIVGGARSRDVNESGTSLIIPVTEMKPVHLIVTAVVLCFTLVQPSWGDERRSAAAAAECESCSSDIVDISRSVREAILRAFPLEKYSSEVGTQGFEFDARPRIQKIQRSGHHIRIEGDPLLPTRRSVIRVQGLAAVDEQLAYELLDALSTELRLFSPRNEYALDSRTEDSAGNVHLRFQQQFKGLPVLDHQAIIHLSRDGAPTAVTGSVLPTPRRVRTEPTVSLERAIQIIDEQLEGTTEDGNARLVIHAETERVATLAWELTRSNGLERELVYVDAHQGNVVERRSLIRTDSARGGGVDVMGVFRELNVWRSANSYFMLDTSKSMWSSQYGSPRSYQRGEHGVIAISDHAGLPVQLIGLTIFDIYSADPNNFRPPEAVSAAYLLSNIYDFYRERFNRHSFDGEGKSIISLVRIFVENAFWDGNVIGLGYPNRYAGASDVVAHEFAHAVVEHSANLKYESESGAVNESFSDVLGQAFETWLTGAPDWEIGEDVGTPIRSFAQPELYEQPSKMSDFRSLPLSEDYGGVHINSGIFNHAYYQMAAAVPGAIDVERASDIYYHALVNHLRPTSGFADAAQALIDSAVERYGSNSLEHEAVLEALRRVELFETEKEEEPPVYTPVSGADSFLFAFQDDEGWFLGRREVELGDPADGVYLSVGQMAPASRISVTGDGSLAFFVSADFDACFIETSGEYQEQCLEMPGKIGSVAMSPDGTRFGLILLDESGSITNQLFYVDLETDVERHLILPVPVVDGASSAEILAADSLAFDLSGTSLYYDAFSQITVDEDETIGTWSIYEYDPAANLVFSIVSPVRGFNFAYPSPSRTSEQYLTFDALDFAAEQSIVWILDLFNWQYGKIYTIPDDYGLPSFTGEDATLIFAYPDDSPSGYSIAEIPLAANRLSATENATYVIYDADVGATYRRGTFSGPSTEPGRIEFSSAAYGGREGSSTVISLKRLAGRKGRVEARYDVVGGTASAGSDYQMTGSTLSWEDGDDRDQRITLTALEDSISEGNETVIVRLTGINGTAIGQVTQATITIEDRLAPPAAPSNLIAEDSTGDAVTLRWSDNSSNEEEFVLYYSLDGTTFIEFGETAQDTSAVRVTELFPETRYWFRVTARNATGESAPSNTVTVNDDTDRRRPVRRR